MADLKNETELTLEDFAKQIIAEVDIIKKQKDDAFKARNVTHYNEMAALSAKQAPYKKLLSDYYKAKNGGEPVAPAKGTRGGVRVKKVI